MNYDYPNSLKPVFCLILAGLFTSTARAQDPTDLGYLLEYVRPTSGTTHMDGIAGDGAGRLLVVGGDGAMTSSTDGGANWTFHSLGQRDVSLGDAAYGVGTFLVARSNRSLLATSDFLSWEEREIPGLSSVSRIEYLNGQFIAIKGDTLATSADGISWQLVESLPIDATALAFGHGLYVAVGGGGAIYTSPDLLAWDQEVSDTSDLDSSYSSFGHVRFSEDVFVAVGARGLVCTSPNGLDWTRHDLGASSTLFDGVRFNGKYLIPGSSGQMHRSDDLITWEMEQIANESLKGFYVSGGILYAAGRAGTLLKTIDGANWESIRGGADARYEVMASGKGLLVTGTELGEIFSSSDGLTWTLRDASIETGFAALKFDGTQFVAVHYGGSVLQSQDGISWNPKPEIPASPFGLVRGPDAWVTVGRDGAILTSSDLNSWDAASSGVTEDLNDVAFGNGMYMAVGAAGTILTSSDGTNWAAQESGTTRPLRNVAYGAGRWVVAGHATSLHSVDGITWEELAFPRPATTNSLEFVGGHFIAIGYLGGIDHSEDGITWIKERTQSDVTIQGIGFIDNRWVTVGDYGTHMVTDPSPEWNVFASATVGGTVTSTVDLSRPVADGSVVTLTATPAEGYIFNYWTGTLEDDGENVAAFTVSEHALITAVFIPTPSYIVEFDISGDGNVMMDPPLTSVMHGSEITLTALPAAGNKFLRWGGSVSRSTANPLVVTVERDHTIEVEFSALAQLSLTTSVSGEGTVTKSPDAETYLEGTSVTVTATPAAGYRFVNWLRNLSGNENPAVVEMTGSKRVTAVFEKLAVNYTLTLGTVGNGTIEQSPAGPTHSAGTPLTLTPTPGPGYRFVRWTGAAGGTSIPLSFIMDSDKSITAEFELASAFDRWAAKNFSIAEQANATISGRSADPDHDGADNFGEFFASTSPLHASSLPDLTPSLVEVSGQTYLAVSYTQPTEPTERDGYKVVIETSTDGQIWRAESGMVHIDSSPIQTAGYESITSRLPLPIVPISPTTLVRMGWVEE